jgi:hypothetical protein
VPSTTASHHIVIQVDAPGESVLTCRIEDVDRLGCLAGAAGFFTLVILMPDPWTVADREVAEALASSFLGRLPSDLVDVLVEVGERTDYPAGSRSAGGEHHRPQLSFIAAPPPVVQASVFLLLAVPLVTAAPGYSAGRGGLSEGR